MQDRLNANRRERSLAVGAEAPSLLGGFVFDADGNRMTRHMPGSAAAVPLLRFGLPRPAPRLLASSKDLPHAWDELRRFLGFADPE